MVPHLPYNLRPVGDHAVELSFGNVIAEPAHQRLIQAKLDLEANPFKGMLDVVIAFSSITIIYDPWSVMQSHVCASAYQFVTQALENVFKDVVLSSVRKRKIIEVPVCYEEDLAPDWAFVQKQTGLSRTDIVHIHVSKTYTVFMVGFLPGFPYLGEVDDRIAVPRKEKPTLHVSAGSVGLAGKQTGIYPLDSPGGWQVIGRTPMVIFAKEDPLPAKFEPGDHVRFFPISKKEFALYQKAG